MKRRSYQYDDLDEKPQEYDGMDGRREVGDGQGNLISSMTDTPTGELSPEIAALFGEEHLHMPVIDIDHPCRLVESSTPGHFHLYIDVPMKGERFFDLLDDLVAAGIVEEGYASVSRHRGEAFVRKPGVTKPTL